MRNNVTKLKTPGYARRIRGAEAAMYAIRTEMEWYEVKVMAEACDVSVACLYAIERGQTKWPRPKTFFALIDFLGLEMLLVKP